MSEIWSLFTYEMVQPNLVRGFLLSRRERNITVNENRDSTTSQRRGSRARGKGQMCSQNHSQVWTWQLVHGCLNFSLHLRSRCLLEWGGTRQAPRNISFADESWNPTKSKQVVVVEKFKTTVSSSELQNIAHVHPQRNMFNPLYFPCLGKCWALIYFSPLMFLMAVAFLD